jgi:cytochrome c2
VNKQVTYITYAHLILAAAIGSWFFISKIPFSASHPTNDVSHTVPIEQSTVSIPDNVVRGEISFRSKCASCHHINKVLTGPSLEGFEERGPWSDRLKLYEWIRNPAVFMQKNEYARKLKESYGGTMMTGFAGMSNEEIDAIVAYINYKVPIVVTIQ